MSLVADRLRAAIEAVVRALVPPIDGLALYECQVVAWHDGDQSADLVPVSTSSPLPPAMSHVPQRVGPPGTKLTLVVGSRVLVGFVNGELSRPEIRYGDIYGSGGFVPTHVDLAAGTAGAARVGDSIQLSQCSVVLDGGVVVAVKIGGTTLTPVPASVSGTITSGSSIVRIG